MGSVTAPPPLAVWQPSAFSIDVRNVHYVLPAPDWKKGNRPVSRSLWIGSAEAARNFEDSRERLSRRRRKIRQLLLGFSKRSVDDKRRVRRFRAPSQPLSVIRRATGPSFPADKIVLHDLEFGYDGIVFLLGPGTDDVPGMVAKYRVCSAGCPCALSQGRMSKRRPQRSSKNLLPTLPAGRIAAKACGDWLQRHRSISAFVASHSWSLEIWKCRRGTITSDHPRIGQPAHPVATDP